MNSSPAHALHPLHPDRAGPATDYSGQSNLALSCLCLSQEKRADMNVFYTFCRVVDDIADSPEVPVTEKPRLLDAWKSALRSDLAPVPGHAPAATLLAQVQTLITKYELPRAHFH